MTDTHYPTIIMNYVIGLDLGGTNAVFGIVDRKGNILTTTSVKTQAYATAEQFVDASVQALQGIIEEVGGISNIAAMGIGAPNGNYYTGSVEFAPNLQWAHNRAVPLAAMFKERLDIPVALTNDANAAAIGEMKYGVARDMKNFIVITLGTGVGSGIVINGQLVYGCDGFAGELGHAIVVSEGGRECGCGRKGCLEAYCSATGVARTAKEMLTKTSQDSLLRQMPIHDAITSYDVSKAAEKGDQMALDIYTFTGKILGQACANFTTFCSPEAYIFFGGLTNAGDLIMKPIKEAYEESVLRIFKGKAKFLVSALEGASAAVLGASAIGWELVENQ